LSNHPAIATESLDVQDYISHSYKPQCLTRVPFLLGSARFPYVGDVAKRGAVVGIVGNMGWAPTRRAVEVLLRKVWPLVSRRVPRARLVIAGWRAQDVLETTALPPRVEVVSDYSDSMAVFGRIRCLAYPCLIGGGPKVKVLEAIARGTPVVTTRLGAIGLEGPGPVVTSSAVEMAGEISAVLEDRTYASERSEVGRSTFESRHSESRASEVLDDLVALVTMSGK
jgi:glycosyltransferase involved in cell wall biosynthesis